MTNLGGKKPRPNVFVKKEKQDNKSRSVRHESRIAKSIGARVQPNSGALPFISQKGDLTDDHFVWQAKLTKNGRLSLTSDVIAEVYEQACMTGKRAGLALTLEGLPDHLPKDWIAVPLDVWQEIMEDSDE